MELKLAECTAELVWVVGRRPWFMFYVCELSRTQFTFFANVSFSLSHKPTRCVAFVSISVRQSMCHCVCTPLGKSTICSDNQAHKPSDICSNVTNINTHTHTQRKWRTVSIENQICTPYLSSHFQFGTRNMGYYEIWPKWVINFQNWMCKRIDNQQLLIRIIEVGLKERPQMSQTKEETNLPSMRTINGEI